ncbi:hypothetical protein HK099_007991 [Clydaea vesicula]|uniref:N-acetyltransferase domain-containing protein n=1 Tax=Clydaea vesicula TaxID=447962 RepID=A0AAD5U0N4_9FUNG|nr:hypothetical protein HK099_007991 [Clydaea vesicula]KAJ3381686.1 hypothetical protein HDU92_005203 [Lobulomyces angularis]
METLSFFSEKAPTFEQLFTPNLHLYPAAPSALNSITYCILLNNDHIGFVNLFFQQNYSQVVLLPFIFDSYRSNGYGAEALKEILKTLFNNSPHLNCFIILETNKEKTKGNIAQKRVLEKLGFRFLYNYSFILKKNYRNYQDKFFFNYLNNLKNLKKSFKELKFNEKEKKFYLDIYTLNSQNFNSLWGEV